MADTAMKFRVLYTTDSSSATRVSVYKNNSAEWNLFVSLQFHIHFRGSELYGVCRVNWLITLTLAILERHKNVWWI